MHIHLSKKWIRIVTFGLDFVMWWNEKNERLGEKVLKMWGESFKYLEQGVCVRITFQHTNQ